MGRVHIRPPEGYFDWPREQQLEWVGALLAEVMPDEDGYDAESERDAVLATGRFTTDKAGYAAL